MSRPHLTIPFHACSWPSLDSFDGSEPAPRHSDKANRLLGKPLPELHNTFLPPGTLDASVSEFSSTFRLSPHSSPGEDDSYKDDECFADDSHDQRESTLLSPVEFRPPSIAVFTAHPSDVDTASELDVEEQTPSEPVTPVAPFDPPQFRTPTNRRYSHSQPPHASDHMQDRPDTPSIGTLVAVNSQVLVARGSHTRHPSVVRIEPSWVGEWNQCDMQDVIQKLRSLK
ncbi:hypothetical protein B0H10DRAFT_1958560 [Mycena sp. CBHHK59/15]|nr:hypothetical protein B0H10DRAFT_1958560 [Mycena sp. CBHHK59/15]